MDPRDIGRGLLLLEPDVPERERAGAWADGGCLWWFCASMVVLRQISRCQAKNADLVRPGPLQNTGIYSSAH